MDIKNIVKTKVFSKLGAFCTAMLPIVLAFQNCSVLDMKEYGKENVDLSSSSDVDRLVQGKTLYSQSCAACHGPIDSSTKRTRSSTQISVALDSRPEMAAIRLTGAEVALIAFALSNDASNPPPVVNENNRQEFACTPGQIQKTPLVKLTNREYINALSALLDDFATTLKSDATLISLFNGIPTDIASENRNTLKEQSLLMTAPISNGVFNASFRAAELVAGATAGLQNYPNTNQCLNATTITQACHQSFVRELGSRAFRRQLSVTEGNSVAARYWDTTLSKTDLLKLTFASIATMPDFLYKIYDQGSAVSGSTVLSLTAYEFATKMAFFLTGAPADATLKALAANGQIFNDTVISQQADRLLATAGAKDMIRRLFRESYGYDVYDRLQYDSAFINGASTTGLADVMTAELDNFFVEVVLNKSGSFLDVMTSRYSNATDSRLATIYGASGATLPDERSGFLSRASMLTKRSGNTASPIKRGLNIIEHVLCDDIGLPPPSAPTSLPVITEETVTTRIRTSRATEAAGTTCVGCHGKFNSLGFAFENFDSFGRFRTNETIYNNTTAVASLPVDSNITTAEITGTAISTSGPHQFVEKLGISDRAMMCFTKHIKRFEARIPADATANCQMNQSLKTMYGDTAQGSIVGAIKSLVLSPEFRRWNN